MIFILHHTVKHCIASSCQPVGRVLCSWWYILGTRASWWWSYTASRTHTGYPCVALPCAVVPVPFTFSEMPLFFFSAALSVDVSGQAPIAMSVREKLALTAWLGYFPLVYGISGGRWDHPYAVSYAGTNQKSSGFSWHCVGFYLLGTWCMPTSQLYYSVSGGEDEVTKFQIFHQRK